MCVCHLLLVSSHPILLPRMDGGHSYAAKHPQSPLPYRGRSQRTLRSRVKGEENAPRYLRKEAEKSTQRVKTFSEPAPSNKARVEEEELKRRRTPTSVASVASYVQGIYSIVCIFFCSSFA